jgi:hypothetical protein
MCHMLCRYPRSGRRRRPEACATGVVHYVGLAGGTVREFRPHLFVTSDRTLIGTMLMFVSSDRAWMLAVKGFSCRVQGVGSGHGAGAKVELYAAIRRDARAGMPGRAIERKHGVGRRTIIKALSLSGQGQDHLHIPESCAFSLYLNGFGAPYP